MAVSSPGRNAQETLLTATWPPKRMVRSRVSRERVMDSVVPAKAGTHKPSPCEENRPRNDRNASTATTRCMGPRLRGDDASCVAHSSPLVLDRDVHVLDLELADRLEHRPGQRRVDLDLEVIHALQRLMVLLAEHHLALRRVEFHAFHRGDQL